MTQQAQNTLLFEDTNFILNTDPFAPFVSSESNKYRFKPITSMCWSGYVTDWAIIDKKLYLTSLSGTVGTGWMTEQQMNSRNRPERLKNFLNGIEDDIPEAVHESIYDHEMGCMKFKYTIKEDSRNHLDDEILRFIDLKEVFQNAGEPVFASWFSGSIELDDELIVSDDPEAGKDYIYLEVKEGLLLRDYKKYMTNKERFDEFQSNLKNFREVQKKKKIS